MFETMVLTVLFLALGVAALLGWDRYRLKHHPHR